MPPKRIPIQSKPAATGNKPTTQVRKPNPSTSGLGTNKSNLSGTRTTGTKPKTINIKSGAVPTKIVTKTQNQTKSNPDENKVKKQEKTVEDVMATKIQTMYRGFRSRRALLDLKLKKQEYNKLMDEIEKAAFIKLVHMEREQQERQTQRELQLRRKQKEKQNRKKKMLEAAFEGNINEIQKMLKETEDSYVVEGHEAGSYSCKRAELELINCTDANDNTPLSESGAGGTAKAIGLLISLGADVNSIGQYGRTPLYRAAFGGHQSAVELLLKHGADPRIPAHDGSTPKEVAPLEDTLAYLSEWDIDVTLGLLEKLEIRKEQITNEDLKYKQDMFTKMNDSIEEIEKEYKVRHLELSKAHLELEKRISEHDLLIAEGTDKSDLTLPAIHQAEMELEGAKMRTETVRMKLQEAKLHLREQKMKDSEEDEMDGVKCMIIELDEVLMRDVGNKIADSGKWPLIIDFSGQSAVFLRYRDTNYIDAIRPNNVEPEVIRLAVIGALRFGKMLVLDMQGVYIWEQMFVKFSAVLPDLLTLIMNKNIMKQENYSQLVRDTDGEEYEKVNFMHGRVEFFKFVILTKLIEIPTELLEITYPIKIILPE